MDLGNFTGLDANSAERMVLDVGILVVALNEEELETNGIIAALNTPWMYNGVEVTARPLGATRKDGANFDPGKEERQIEVAGARGPLMGFSRVDNFAPTLGVTILQMADPANMALAIGQADITTTASGYQKMTPRLGVEPGDYLPNIAIITRTSEAGQDKPLVVVLRNAKVVENAPFEFADPGELAPQVTFQGHYSVQDLFNVPFCIYTPVLLGGSGS